MTQQALTPEIFWDLLQEVKDPEIPTVSMIEMGMIGKVEVDGGKVTVDVLPTFIGCPAIEIMKKNIVEKLSTVEGVQDVQVNFVFEPAWTSDRITEEGREKLASFGIAPPPKVEIGDIMDVKCPFCNSENIQMDNLFGPAACRSILYCNDCKNPFEAIKPI